MTANRKPKPIAKTKLVFRQPTVKEVEAIAHASNRISKRRKRVHAKVEVADGLHLTFLYKLVQKRTAGNDVLSA